MSSDNPSSDDKKVAWTEQDGASRVGSSVLASIPTFSGTKEDKAKGFIQDLEEALDLANVSADKLKKFHFKTKLRGLPAEWYETTRDDEEFTTWESIRAAFLHQFDKQLQDQRTSL